MEFLQALSIKTVLCESQNLNRTAIEINDGALHLKEQYIILRFLSFSTLLSVQQICACTTE